MRLLAALTGGGAGRCAWCSALTAELPAGPDHRVPLPGERRPARAPATRPTRRCTRWPTAACSASGSGQGRAKWDYLPNAHNDFIFAIIGEELGFLGAFAVLALFATLAYTGLRIAARNTDPWLKLVVATSTTWLVGAGRRSTSATSSGCCR